MLTSPRSPGVARNSMRILLYGSNAPAQDASVISISMGLRKAYQNLGHTLEVLVQRGRESDLRSRARDNHRRLLSLLPRIDFVHWWTAGCWNAVTWGGWEACRKMGVPVGVMFEDYFPDKGIRFPKGLSHAAGLGGLLDVSRFVAAVSRPAASRLANDFPGHARRIRVVPYGFDPDEIALARVGPQRQRAFILCVARLAPYKGIDVLLMAFRNLCDADQKAELVICGRDYERGHYQRLARLLRVEGRVRFLGNVPRRRVMRLMRRCLFFVFPSRVESFGMAALEAQAHGKAVVATRSGGPEAFVRHGVSGLVVPPNDPAALARAMLKLLRDEPLRRSLESRAEAAAADFTWERSARRYLALIRASINIR